jgi:methionyl-tRNA formyltransferase
MGAEALDLKGAVGVRVVFLGTGEFGVLALRALHRAGHRIVAVVSQPDRPAGRGRVLRPTSIRAAAEGLGLRHLQAEDVNTLDVPGVFGQAEIAVVAAFGQKIGGHLLAALPRGCVNIHASLLPKYRGAAPIQRAIMDGEEVTGVTVFQLDDRWDAGPIWTQRSTRIRETETADELHARLAELGAGLIVDTLVEIESATITPRPQDPAQATRAAKLTKAEGTVNWSQPAQRIVRRIHGLWSWPAAACQFVSRGGKQERLLLARAMVADPVVPPTEASLPGAFCEDLTVQAGVGRVRLLEVQPAGGKLMPFNDFANGRRVAPPDRLLPADT